MTQSQEKSIREYLKSKNLPLELLIEIEDHFMSQIHDYQKEDIDFDQAFEKTKEIWKEELTLTWDGGLDLQDKCELLRNYRKAKRNTLIKQTIKYSAIVLTVVFTLFFILPTPLDKTFLLITYLTFALAPILLFIYKWKEYKILRKSKTQISYYQIGLLSTSMLMYNILQMTRYIWESEKIVNFVDNPWKSTFILIVLSTVYIISIGSLICHKELLKTIKSLKHHLA